MRFLGLLVILGLLVANFITFLVGAAGGRLMSGNRPRTPRTIVRQISSFFG
jgi:hypothetical protein